MSDVDKMGWGACSVSVWVRSSSKKVSSSEVALPEVIGKTKAASLSEGSSATRIRCGGKDAEQANDSRTVPMNS